MRITDYNNKRILYIIFFFLLVLVLNNSVSLCADKSAVSLSIRNAKTGEPVIGATTRVKDSNIGAISNTEGIATLKGISRDSLDIIITCVGYNPASMNINLNSSADTLIAVSMEEAEIETDDVVVSAMRTSRTISTSPTRVEAVTMEELDENAAMNSANIAMLLSETTGIQVQQTSQASGNARIKIEGLDGRYTQILRDGFPVYDGLSGGLSIMQIPPLDLRQVEVVKGSASTLYGGGAIAGIINLVGKTPSDKPELSFLFNQTSALGTSLNGFYSDKFNDRLGITLYAAANYQKEYDANKDNFSDLPNIKSICINPKLYLYFPDSSSFSAGLQSVIEDRRGGDMNALADVSYPDHIYVEANKSSRLTTQLAYTRPIGNVIFNAKNSLNFYHRIISLPGYMFDGTQFSSYSEINGSLESGLGTTIFGANYYSDNFYEKQKDSLPVRNNFDNTFGLFAQNDIDLFSFISLETGLRADYNFSQGLFLLPRVAVLFRLTDDLSLRLSGGTGYRTPGIFSEDAERLSFRGVLPVSSALKSETSTGTNLDLNYRTILLEDLSLTTNVMFFYSNLKNALVLGSPDSRGYYSFENADGPVTSAGAETNLRLSYREFSLYMNYTYIYIRLQFNNLNRQKPLTPNNSLGMSLLYEIEKNLKAGLESYYIGPQYLSDNTQTRSYWMAGFMVMKQFGNLVLFINFENMTDTRQSHWESLVDPPYTNPVFRELWAPSDGFVANAGFRISL